MRCKAPGQVVQAGFVSEQQVGPPGCRLHGSSMPLLVGPSLGLGCCHLETRGSEHDCCCNLTCHRSMMISRSEETSRCWTVPPSNPMMDARPMNCTNGSPIVIWARTGPPLETRQAHPSCTKTKRHTTTT
jgi:hypothetical protein